jgi:hypothetical protein
MTTPMVRTTCSTAIAAVCLCLSTTAFADTAFADIPPPDSPAARLRQAVPLRITEHAEAEVHRIVIPKAVLAKLAGDLPDAGSIAAATPTRSIVAAVAVSAAVACGLVAFRRGRADRLAAVVICGLSLAGAGAVLLGEPAFADKALPGQEPRRPRPQPVVTEPESVTLAQGGSVILEVGAADGDAVVLVVGKAAVKPK